MKDQLAGAIFHHIGGRLFIVLWGGMTAASFGSGVAGVRPALVLVLVGACAVGLPLLQAVAVAGVGWLVLDGFVAHRYGDLAFHRTDLAWAPLVMLVVATAAMIPTGAHR